MNITLAKYDTVSNNTVSKKEPAFKHGGESFWKSDYTTKDKLIVAGTTVIGVVSSLAALTKAQGYKLNFKNVRKYFENADFLFKEIVALGAGSCLGGLAGGYIIDKNPQNRKAKRREAVMQIGNITIPIATVAGTNKLCDLIKISDFNG